MTPLDLDDGLLRAPDPDRLAAPPPPGSHQQYPAVIDLGHLGDGGFTLVGEHANDFAGFVCSGVGDVNGDGFDDVAVGAGHTSDYAYGGGAAYVVYGGPQAPGHQIDLGSLDPSQGFRIDGHIPFQDLGLSLDRAGDVNGDGVDDFVVGNDFGSRSEDGGGQVIFGRTDGFAPALDPADLDGTDGFRFFSHEDGDLAGAYVAGAGDVNGDGYDDIVIGAPFAHPNGEHSGSAYVVFGHAGGFDPDIDLQALDGTDGFRFDATEDEARLGAGVASAGDFNGDGVDDLMIGAFHPNGSRPQPGSVYLIYGARDGFPARFDASDIDGSNGFRLTGEAINDGTGEYIGPAGDINGDGFADLAIGAISGGPDRYGAAYVVFGHVGANPAQFDLSSLDGSNGFKVIGGPLDGELGRPAAGAGDVNGDGFADVIIGSCVNSAGGPNAGAAYVIFGKATGFDAVIDVTTLDGSNGFMLQGPDEQDLAGISAVSAGDINNDGLGDLILGGYNADPHEGVETGASWVVYGRLPTTAVDRTGTAASQSLVGGDLGDRLKGLDGDDALWGHGGHDRLAGGAGADTLTGGAGKDVLAGGADDDVFRFLAASDSAGGEGVDRILDLQAADIIDLSAIDADATTAGDQAFHLAGGFHGGAGSLKIHYKAAQDTTVIAADIDGDGHADLVIRVAGDHHDFTGFVL